MKLIKRTFLYSGGLLACLLIWAILARPPAGRGDDTNAPAPDTSTNAENASATSGAEDPAGTNAASALATLSAPHTNAPAASLKPVAMKKEKSPKPSKPEARTESGSDTNEIQVSFQGANVDMIVQWLAKTTGKSVVKHPQVQCQLTIMSSKKVKPRDAITLVYRALALEGFTAVESSDSIFIVPEGKEPKFNPELLDAKLKEIPEGRQRLLKIIPLAHIQAAEVREKVRGLLSDRGTIDIDERSNQLVVTDYNDNLRLLAEIIHEFDVPASGLTVEIYPLKYADAEELGNMISLIVNAQPATPGSSSRPASSRGSSPAPSVGPMGISFGGPSPSPDNSGGSPSSSGAGSQTPGQQVRIWPDKPSNRLVVFAPKSKLAEVRRLIDVLDTEKPEDVSVRVVTLKNVNATDLVRELSQLYKDMGGRSPKEMIEIAADDRSNAMFVLSSEANFKPIQRLVAALDTEDALEKVVRTFPLKNADAEDVARQLQDLNKDQDNSSGPYRFFYFGGMNNQRGPSRKMSVVADRRRNSLVIQAPPTQMDSIDKMIAELDAPVTDDSLAPRIFPLKYVSAADIEDVLNELFLKKTQQRNYWDFYSDSPSENTDRDVGRLYGKVRITSEPYSNTIIVTSNSKESLAAIEDVLKQLDAPSEANESTLRVGLKFAKAAVVANNINIIFAKNGSPPIKPNNQQNQPQQNNYQQQQQQQTSFSSTGYDLEKETKEDAYYPWIGGQPDNPRSADGRNASRPVSDMVGRVRAVADERGNALLISANVHFFPQILKIIQEMDGEEDQVLIEARLIEVSSDFLDQMGVRWSPDGTMFTGNDLDNSFLASANGSYNKGFGPVTAVNQPASGAASLAQMLTALRAGAISSTISMDFLVQFLHKTANAKVLAQPQLNIHNNETGRLFVGQQVPVITGSQNAGSIGLTSQFRYLDVGVILEVTPHINNEGDVELKIHAESSTVESGVTIQQQPVFNSRKFHTDLTAKNGQTLVLGGIIQKQITDTLRKTPLLGDIPGLGWLFKKRDKENQEVELMVFLRPRVLRTPNDAQDLLQDIYRKAPKTREQDDPPAPKKGGKAPEARG